MGLEQELARGAEAEAGKWQRPLPFALRGWEEWTEKDPERLYRGVVLGGSGRGAFPESALSHCSLGFRSFAAFLTVPLCEW